MFRWKAVFGAVAGTVLASAAGLAFAADQVPAAPSTPSVIEFPATSIDAGLTVAQASEDARYLGRWIQSRNDNAGQPFAIVDKKAARLFVFDAQQTLVGSSTVLTGSAPGDESAPGVGQRAQQSRVAREERTTPAGRFSSEPGHNRAGEDIVWFDYGAALAIHRLRADANYERRARSLATPTPDDNRASLGCVVVPVAFYDRVVRPMLGTRKGTVYVLPETRSVQALWPTLPTGPNDMPRETATLARVD